MKGTHVCMAPDLCAPCRENDHKLCSWDGEPDCLCTECPPLRKARNRKALDRQIGTAYDEQGNLLPEVLA